MKWSIAFSLLAILWSCCLSAQESDQPADLASNAAEISRQALLVDGHIDMPYRLREGWTDITKSAPDRNFDYPRARLGGLDVPFMSIYIPAKLEEAGGSFLLANQLIDSVEALVGRAPEKFAMARSVAQVESAHSSGLISLALGMENGTPLEGDLARLEYFHQRGIRYITLTHALANHISDSSYDENRPWGGLSPFGREVVAEMNRLGIMVDVSHLSDEAFFDVIEVSRVPVIASHSSARHFTPGWERNMSDEMIRVLASNGGIIMINFGSTFLTPEARAWSDAMDAARDAWSAETGHETDGPEATEWQKSYRKTFPLPFADVSDVADHFDHVIGLVGADHVGVGSDYDGVGDSLPTGLKDVASYPNLVEEFLRRGYAKKDIEAILGGNVMRVWRQVENYAASSPN